MSGFGGSRMFVAGGSHRLLADMQTMLTDPSWSWTWEAGVMAARAQELVANDPFSQAMVNAKLDSTHGPLGLRRKSLAYLSEEGKTTTADRTLRTGVTRVLDRARGHTFDASGLLTRRQMMRQLDWLATVLGEGYLIRTLKDGGDHVTRWRLVRPERISNPDNVPNNARLYEGLELDGTGEVVAVWVRSDVIGAGGMWVSARWQRVPVVAKDGTRNVIRRTGLILPGMLRAVSMFAPLVMLIRQLQGTVEAHVTTKRAQACLPIITYTDDPETLAKAEADDAMLSPYVTLAPLKILYAKTGTTVQLPTFDFKGEDLKAFITTGYRLLTASWQQPVEVVLCQMGESSLASARAGLDQNDRTSQTWQEDHIEQAERPVDEAHIAEAVAADELTPGSAGMVGLNAGTYRRPPKYSTDRKKDAETMKALIEAGVSKTTTFAMFGFDFDDEKEQGAQDAMTEEMHQPELPAAPAVPALAAPEPEKPADPTPTTDTEEEPAQPAPQETAA